MIDEPMVPEVELDFPDVHAEADRATPDTGLPEDRPGLNLMVQLERFFERNER